MSVRTDLRTAIAQKITEALPYAKVIESAMPDELAGERLDRLVVNVVYPRVTIEQSRELGAVRQPERWEFDIFFLIPGEGSRNTSADEVFDQLQEKLVPPEGWRPYTGFDELQRVEETFEGAGQVGSIYRLTVACNRYIA